ncbi:MAG: glyoxalase/bleomycin resistance/extradiol dioxygenase family protein [Hydrocarboniphaga sp.]|uniref:VOC family protein n=1 Tax=Hydrocarboniphaga sp. TaxID=2033016 RepID=UPI00262784C3|nr:VOC family protein [Hydrocarboniphaga sp.]MDB5972899.1 glyoxalase/bleomycin resistance/extradiol dioxygenase family protein [Hydrocarboniphaga sp.]
MILGLRTAIYPAPDLAAAKAWYARVFGVEPYYDQPYYVGFAIGGFELGLIPDATPGADGTQAYWGVDDADAEYARLLGLGAQDLDPVREVGDGVRVGSVLDPFGNRLSLIQNPLFDRASLR